MSGTTQYLLLNVEQVYFDWKKAKLDAVVLAEISGHGAPWLGVLLLF